jgi:hypothetical protein
MTLLIGDTAPDFEADTTEGRIRFHSWAGKDWVVFFSHPADFTPVCTTELGYTAQLKEEFARRGAKALVYCAWGFEIGSTCAARLREHGIDAVTVAGGIGTWRADGLPTEPLKEGEQT